MRDIKKILKSYAGFSLVEMLVAAGMVAGLATVMMKMTDTGTKTVSKISSDLDLKLWQQQILLQKLSQSEACLATFGGVDPDTAQDPVPDLRTTTGAFATPGQIISNSGNNWILDSVKRGPFVPDAVAGLKGTCEVEISVSRVNKKAIGVKTKNIKFPLICAKKNDGTWSSCSASIGSDSHWAHFISPNPSGTNYLHSQGEYVRVGNSDTIDIKAPFEVATNTGFDFPAGVALGNVGSNGVSKSIAINKSNAILFGDSSVIYEEDNTAVPTIDCLNIANGKSGALEKGLKHCSGVNTNNVQIAALNSAAALGSYNSVILGSSNSQVNGDYSAVFGMNSIVTGNRAYAFGNGTEALHNETIVLGSTDGVGYNPSTLINQFSGLYNNGFRFITGTTAANNVYIDGNGSLGIGTDAPTEKLHVAGNVKISGQIVQNTWSGLSFASSWICASGSSCGYYKDSNGIVHLKGRVHWNSMGVCSSANWQLLTLPSGFRPTHQKMFVIPTEFASDIPSGSGAPTYGMYVNSNGQIRGKRANCNTTTDFYLDGISFPTH